MPVWANRTEMMEGNMKGRKGISLLIALMMLFSALPLTSLAAVAPATDTFCPGNSDNQHVWGNWIVTRLATCSETGARSRTCRSCRYTQTETISKEPHDYGAWNVVRESTCSAEGERQRTCRNCGHVDRESIEKKEHTWEQWTVTKEPTCTERGSRTRVCRVCRQKETERMKVLPHAWGEWKNLVEATDHSSGTRTHACTRCGAEETENYDPEGTLRLKDKGDEVKLLNSELICYGVMKGRPSSVFTKNTQNAVKKVQRAEGLEENGVAWPQTRARLGHQFGEWETVAEMTDFSAGVRQRTCARCKYTEKIEDYPSPMYQQGDEGDGVAALQRALTGAGFKPGTADGVFGKKTKAAVQAFQKKNKLKRDGIAWPGVLKLLGIYQEPAQDVSAENTPAEDPSAQDVSAENTPAEDFSAQEGAWNKSGSVTLKNLTPGATGSPAEDGTPLSDLIPPVRSLTVLERPKDDDAYYTGAVVPVKMRLTLDGFDDYVLTGIDCVDGDAYQQENWMFYRLQAGSSYDFTYYMALDPEKCGWESREVTVRLRSINTKAAESETAKVGPPFTYPTVTLEAPPKKTINDYAAYLYLNIRHDEFTGAAYPDENMDIPYTVDSDGNTDIRDVKLVCEQQMLGKTYATQTVPVTVSMAAGSQLSGSAHIKAEKAEGAVSNGYSMNLYLTGTYYNQKGGKETVTSLPVSLSYSILEQSWNPAQLDMMFTVEPRKSAYSLNDSVTVKFTVFSSGTEGVRDVVVGPAGTYASEIGAPVPAEKGELMKPGSEAEAEWIYWIRPEDLQRGYAEIDFAASGTAETSGLPVRSPRATMILPVTAEPPEEKMVLSAAPAASQETFQTGVTIPCVLTVTPDVGQPIKWIRLYATGQNRSLGSTKSGAWHDFGHGIKGFVCELLNSPPSKNSFELKSSVNIPSSAREKGGYCAAWTAEAELKDGTLIQSNTAYLPLAIDPEQAVLEASYTKADYLPDTVLPVVMNLTYSGDHKASHFTVHARLRYKGNWEEKGDMYLDDEGKGSLKILLNLKEEDLVKDKWEFLIQAAAVDRVGSLLSNIVRLEISRGEPAPVVHEVRGKATILSAPASPETGWQLGDKVLIRAEGIYTGGPVPRMAFTREAGGMTHTDTAFECDAISDEMEVTLTEDMVTDEEYYCSYIFEAYDEKDELIASSRPAIVYLKLGVPVYSPPGEEDSDAEAAPESAGESGSEAPESGAPAEGDASSGETETGAPESEFFPEGDGSSGTIAGTPESGAPAEGEASSGESGTEAPESGAPTEGEESPGETETGAPESEFFPEGDGSGGTDKKIEKTAIIPSGLSQPQTAPISRTDGKPGESADNSVPSGSETYSKPGDSADSSTPISGTDGSHGDSADNSASSGSETGASVSADGASVSETGTSASAAGTPAASVLPEGSAADILPTGDVLEALLYAEESRSRETEASLNEPLALQRSVLSAPVGTEEDFCFGAWAGLMENLPEIEVTFCKKHAELPGAGTIPLADPEDAEALWLEALNAEYDALKESDAFAKDAEKTALLEEARERFMAETETLRAENPQELILFRLMLQTAAVCEIRHSAEDPLAALLELTPAETDEKE